MFMILEKHIPIDTLLMTFRIDLSDCSSINVIDFIYSCFVAFPNMETRFLSERIPIRTTFPVSYQLQYDAMTLVFLYPKA